jgi:hypothetical protein
MVFFSLHGAATKQHTKSNFSKSVIFGSVFTFSKGGDSEIQKEKCENVPLRTPLGSAVSRGGSGNGQIVCLRLPLDDCLYHFGAVQTDPPPHL